MEKLAKLQDSGSNCVSEDCVIACNGLRQIPSKCLRERREVFELMATGGADLQGRRPSPGQHHEICGLTNSAKNAMEAAVEQVRSTLIVEDYYFLRGDNDDIFRGPEDQFIQDHIARRAAAEAAITDGSPEHRELLIGKGVISMYEDRPQRPSFS